MGWGKGQSGNPGGRSKVNWQVRERAKQHAMACLERFLRETLHEDPKIALPACKEVLRMAGISFDSEALEKALNERPQQPTPAPTLVASLTTDAPPLN
jgi:hypothetical protein